MRASPVSPWSVGPGAGLVKRQRIAEQHHVRIAVPDDVIQK